MPRKVKRFGWVPDLPDARDLIFSAPPKAVTAAPIAMSLQSGMPGVYDQGQLGSCVANAVGAADQFVRNKEKLTTRFQPSRLFIYYNGRALEGTVGYDSGLSLRDGIRAVANTGVCGETTWPYDINRFVDVPSPKAFTEAAKHRAILYYRVVQMLVQMKSCIVDGYPFVFGFTVYESFEGNTIASTGIMRMPAVNEAVIGGHAVTAVGYDDRKQAVLCRNSWGRLWGLRGYFWMPYAFIADPGMASDFWTIRSAA